MKKIYVILSHTGTILSKIIRINTGAEYTHASIALDENLKKMYSFGRLNPYIAFIGGFVRESKNFGTFKRFKNTEVSILEMEVTDEQYDEINHNIAYMKKNKRKYSFNYLGLVLAGINKKNTNSYRFYCSEFVKYLLEKANVDLDNLPDVTKPEDFKKLKNTKIIYKGYLRDYDIEKKDLLYYLKSIAPKKEIRI